MYRRTLSATPQAATFQNTRDTTDGRPTVPRLYAQGDILIERIDAALPIDGIVGRSERGESVIVAEGEATGHHHRLVGSVLMYRDDALARDVPGGLYVTHVRVESPTARLEHEEHATITLPAGTYRIRRQRQLEPLDAALQDRAGFVED